MIAIVGTWTLVSYKHESFEGIIFYPMGPYALGRLIYTDRGFFSLMIMKANRKQFNSSSVFEASAEEKLAASDGFIAYSGRYAVQDNQIVHEIDMSFFPNWIGTTHRSAAVIANDSLSITTAALSSTTGAQDIAHIVWKKTEIAFDK